MKIKSGGHMKKILGLVLSLLITTGLTQSTNAAIATVAVISGAYAEGLKFALLGLGWVYAGNAFNNTSKKLSLIGVVTGAILLDESLSNISFQKISPVQAKESGLTLQEMISYNLELEEINLVFSEVVSELSENPSKENAKNVWAEYQNALSADAFSALVKLIK